MDSKESQIINHVTTGGAVPRKKKSITLTTEEQFHGKN
jgi:hypothetical protein